MKTKVDYQIVASFLTESETAESTTNALGACVSDWNPGWCLQNFFTEHCEQEINEIKSTFRDKLKRNK